MFDSQDRKNYLEKMPHTLTIKLLNGDELKYSVRAMSGGAKFITHQERLESLVLRHFDLDLDRHYVEFIHDDDDDAYVMAFRDRFESKVGFFHPNGTVWCPPATDMTDEEILRIRDENQAPWSIAKRSLTHNMKLMRRYTADTSIFAIVQLREKTEPLPQDE